MNKEISKTAENSNGSIYFNEAMKFYSDIDFDELSNLHPNSTLELNREQLAAIELFEKSSMSNHPEASFCLASIYLHIAAATDIEKQKLISYAENSLSLYGKSAEQGLAKAQFKLGKILYDGFKRNPKLRDWSLEKIDKRKGYFLIMRAALADNRKAQSFIADLCVKNKNYIDAIYWWEEAANNGDLSSALKLAEQYSEGTNIKQDFFKAFDILINTHNSFDANSNKGITRMLGCMYLFGLGVEKNYAKALEMLQHSIDPKYSYNYDISLRLLSYMHQNGLGVPVNENIANEYLIQCVQSGEKVKKWLKNLFGNYEGVNWPEFFTSSQILKTQLEIAASFHESNLTTDLFSNNWQSRCLIRASDEQLNELESKYPLAVFRARIFTLNIYKAQRKFDEKEYKLKVLNLINQSSLGDTDKEVFKKRLTSEY